MSPTLQKLKCIIETHVEQNSIFQKKTEKSGSILDILKETPIKYILLKLKTLLYKRYLLDWNERQQSRRFEKFEKSCLMKTLY